MIKYIIVDFKGFVHWFKRKEIYIVDPLYIEEFKTFKGIKD